MVADGALFARPDDAYWIDIGTPERYLPGLARPSCPSPAGRARSTAGCVAPVLLEAGRTVEAGGGGARVGRSATGVTVADGARVERLVVLAGARVGPRAVVDGLDRRPRAP